MEAWLFDSFGGPENLALREVEDPKADLGSAIVEVTHAGVNPVDRSILSGRFDWISLPHVPGAEFIGRVTEVPDWAHWLKRGQRVAVMPNLFCGRCYYCVNGNESSCLQNSRIEKEPYLLAIHRQGGWAEKVVVPLQNIVPLPDSIDSEQACTLPVDGLTAWHLTRRVGPKAGETALIMGSTGGIGTFAVQIVKLHGCVVIAVVGDDEHSEAMSKLGADHVVNRNKVDVAKRVKELTSGRGVDIVVDPVGAATWKTSVASLAPMGRYVTCGVLTGASVELSLLSLYSMQHQIIGSTTGSKKDLYSVVQLMAQKRINAVVDSVHPFSELRKAFARLGQHGRFGKVILRVSEKDSNSQVGPA